MRWFFWKEIGWKEIGEVFHRFYIFKCRYFSIKLHRIEALKPHAECHDHPWHFWTLILIGGYDEITDKGSVFRGPGSILYRNATFTHNTVTRGVSWSIIFTSHNKRKWSHRACGVRT